ncbi:hypothetical protein [Dialister hominis]|uniref:hypothetical protein n=1 Tax=Dialister hominis TaxID=2582419 RepID=UPI003520BD47
MNEMVGSEKAYSKLFASNTDCMRPIGGSCVGNCRKTGSNSDCMRPIGGSCVGNCRKTGGNVTIKW